MPCVLVPAVFYGHKIFLVLKVLLAINSKNKERIPMKNAYLIGHITVKDQEKWTEYRNKVPATLEPWGAKLILRGKLCSVLSGNHEHIDTVVIRFPNLEALNNWYSSPEYQSLIPIRQEAAKMDLLSYEE